MYRVTCTALLAAPWLIFASVQTAEAANINVSGSLKDGPPAPVTETWTGLHVGGGIGVSILHGDLNADGHRKDTIFKCREGGIEYVGENEKKQCKEEKIYELFGLEQENSFNLDDSGDAGFLGTVQIGYDKQINSRYVVGAFADVDWSSAKAKFNQSSLVGLNIHGHEKNILTASANSEIEQDWGYTLGGRVGWLATPRTLLYFLAGYTKVHLDNPTVNFKFKDPLGFIEHINSPTDLTVKLPDELDGYTVGGGIETKLRQNWSLKFEYRFSDLDGGSGSASSHVQQCCKYFHRKKIGRLIESGAKADLDAQLHTVRLVLSYKFGARQDQPEPLK